MPPHLPPNYERPESPPRPAAFPLLRLVLVISLTGLVIALALVAATQLGIVRDLTTPIGVSLTASVLAGIAGLLPVSLGASGGVNRIIAGYFVGTGLRLVVCAALVGLALALLDIDLQPLLLTVTGFYVPLVLVEAGMIGRYLWRLDETADPVARSGPTSASAPPRKMDTATEDALG